MVYRERNKRNAVCGVGKRDQGGKGRGVGRDGGVRGFEVGRVEGDRWDCRRRHVGRQVCGNRMIA